MRELYREYFHVPRDGKIREKAMLARVVMTVGIFIACLAAMSFSAFAYFTHNVTSGRNIIKAADFKITVSVFDSDGVTVAEEVAVVTSNYKSYQLEGLNEGETYVIRLGLSEANTAKTGFVELSADWCSETYFTQQLGVDKNAPGEKTETVTFQLTVNDVSDDVNTKSVRLRSHWGTASCYDKYKNSASEQYIVQADYYAEEEKCNYKIELSNRGKTTLFVPQSDVIYVVQENDNLWEIAKAYDVSVDALMAYNEMTDNIIQVGEEIRIPPDDWTEPKDSEETETPPVFTPPPVTTVPVGESNESGGEEEGTENGEKELPTGSEDEQNGAEPE